MNKEIEEILRKYGIDYRENGNGTKSPHVTPDGWKNVVLGVLLTLLFTFGFRLIGVNAQSIKDNSKKIDEKSNFITVRLEYKLERLDDKMDKLIEHLIGGKVQDGKSNN